MFARRNTAGRKVTSDQVEELRRRYDSGETQAALGRAYGLSVVQVGRIVRGESWMGSATLHKAEVVRQPSDAEIQESARRMYEQQQARDVLSTTPTFSPPISLLDGGDTSDETAGTGLAAMQAKARELLGK